MSSTAVWDPDQYARYSRQRSRPFFDLIGQVRAADPRSVVDLGCGSGELTLTLAQKWPGAAVRGVDSSAEMIRRCPTDSRTSFTVGRVQDFVAAGTDVLVSNAALQWVPEHRELLRTWADALAPDGWLAFQVPANFTAPSHELLRTLAAAPRWRDQLATVGLREDAVSTPAQYLELLSGAGLDTEVWQTDYLHVLPGPDPVLDWVRGTALRPVLAALTDAAAARFVEEYAVLLREAYPATERGTVFPFLRTFVVAHKH